MGIPKFFRWISERYPLCSNLVEENKIPHPNDDNPHFRITEEQIFLAIFNYIDALFAKIKPTSVFFMAVDGVAPRAKMNQQRSRRFRTAKDAEDSRKKALAKGEELPKEKAFDSNCITPGTTFMARLSENLKYFIAKKISEDASWASITVILSGHDVPGEGEHKIMEYIRSVRASENYTPNTRHCLYGLDADLIMLGLLSHEPHFALLREEITFGGRGTAKKTLATANPDSQNFYLMHLSIFREYLDMEFNIIQESLVGFEYSLERVIDDFILLSFFVGNDFLPHLPGLHINEGALATFFKIYKDLLPSLGGYINENGEINLQRLELLLMGIGEMEREVFDMERGDSGFIESKKQEFVKGKKTLKNKRKEGSKSNSKNGDRKLPLYLSRQQKALYDKIRAFIMSPRSDESVLFFPTQTPPVDTDFIIGLSKELGLRHGVAFDPSEEISQSLQTQKLFISWEDGDLDDESDEESNEARLRILKRYDFAEVLEASDLDDMKEQEGKVEVEHEFRFWKSEYYREKLEINYNNYDELSKIVYSYIEGLQWVLLYYYRGVQSWGWFYPYHYAPKITDLQNIERFHPIKFEKGRPFLPFYQLMGVLPAASKDLIPPPFRDLMTDPGSPILDFYPTEFELDLNGKKQDWEAIVKIPFIDEVRLIRTLKAREAQLTKDEVKRNTLGHSFKFIRNPDPKAPTIHRASPSPDSFPDIPKCCALQLVFDIPSDVNLKFGLLPGNFASFHPGFPTLKTLPHTSTLGYHGVTVFQQESQRETVVVTLKSAMHIESSPTEKIALHLLKEKNIFVGWPFLHEALVVKVSDELMSYQASNGIGALVADARDILAETISGHIQDQFFDSVEKTEQMYSKRYGVITGPVEVIVTVRLLKGMILVEDGSMVKNFATDEVDVALQTVVEGREHEDPRYKEVPPPAIADEFYIGSSVFFLGPINYGGLGEVRGYSDDGDLLTVKLLAPLNEKLEQDLKFTKELARLANLDERYTSAIQICKTLKISSLALSKLTSSLFVTMTGSVRSKNGGSERANFGLNMKFEGKGKKVLGMTRKVGTVWEYSQSAIELIREYISRFPEVVKCIDRSRGSDMFADTDLFPSTTIDSRIEELKGWIKSIGVKDFEKVSLDAQALTKSYVQNIETSIDAIYAEAGIHVYGKAKTFKNIPRNYVLKPSHSPFRCGIQKFDLGDRVVNVSATGIVPLGALGTIIAIESGRVVDVVFDVTFMSGVNLDGRCSPHRGMSVYKDSLLNISNPQPLSGSTATVSAAQSRPNIPDRVPGKPLMNSSEKERQVNTSSAAKPKTQNLPEKRGIVTTGIESKDTEVRAIGNSRTVWSESGSNVHSAIKNQSTSEIIAKDQRHQILKNNAHVQNSATPANKPPATVSETAKIDELTQSLKSMLSIGSNSALVSNTVAITGSSSQDAIVQQQQPTSQDISQQILASMASVSQTIPRWDQKAFVSPPQQMQQYYGGAYNPNYQVSQGPGVTYIPPNHSGNYEVPNPQHFGQQQNYYLIPQIPVAQSEIQYGNSNSGLQNHQSFKPQYNTPGGYYNQQQFQVNVSGNTRGGRSKGNRGGRGAQHNRPQGSGSGGATDRNKSTDA
ncbi:hypothetical protein HK100_000328 [Physocladia obscura]|uniref:5'-3' exoribonuclease 1 n=1 Tax=Physocladia obscura TaxID=109957 RepID=A0AAD5XBW1_9FUNG|nr:hypothetical protein HK100_000328 [Physocladia obscura]